MSRQSKYVFFFSLDAFAVVFDDRRSEEDADDSFTVTHSSSHKHLSRQRSGEY
jgi:hypothetical protein